MLYALWAQYGAILDNIISLAIALFDVWALIRLSKRRLQC